MLKLKLLNLLSLILCFTSVSFVAKAAPVTYSGSKGQYTVDREAGTYKGSKVYIYEKNKEIFQDSFVNIQAFAAKPTTPEVKYGLITDKCIGSACLGMTFGQLKAKLGNKVNYKVGQFMVDIDAVQVIQDGKVQYEICYGAGEKLRDKDKITCLSTTNGYYRTKEGVGPSTSLIQAQKIYGRATVSYNTDNESREELKFSKLPKGYQRIWFRPQSKSEGYAGIYADWRKAYNQTNRFKPDAYIWQVMINKE